ncbi:calcium-dependent protein kinase 3, putative [Plasmodium ovale]|uniref:Calcium-dependent protein kinase 3, putative n=2 Tax=Plasmodium ovale TaxID=36330 RepID=A0A1C3L4X1_PLAOA|nr:calcium-dependent protein kinase 3, putative [Plasmodium ovale]
MSLKKTPFSFISDIISNIKNEKRNHKTNSLGRANSYEHIKGANVSELGNFRIVKILLRGLSSTVCLCKWVINRRETLILGNYVNYINSDLQNWNIKLEETNGKNISNDYVENDNSTTICSSEEIIYRDKEVHCRKNCKTKRVDSSNEVEYCIHDQLENTNPCAKNREEHNVNCSILDHISNCDQYKSNITGSSSSDKILHLAVKIKHKELYHKIYEVGELREEIEIHKNLKHSNILPLILSAEDENDIWVFLEYSSIGDLYSYVGFNILQEIEVKIIVSQILYALYYLHLKGIIHCDIKPENLLLFRLEEPFQLHSDSLSYLDGARNIKSKKLNIKKLLSSINESAQINPNTTPFKNIVKIGDFGLSVKCEFDQYYPFRGIKGSYGFIAPELFQGRNFNNKVDMWALGIIVYVLLGGYRPFYPCSKFEEKVTFHERYWFNISPEAKNFIQSLLQINPSKRLNVIEAIEHPWIKSYFIST